MANRVFISGVNTSSIPKLKNAEIAELMKKVKQGDEFARDQFVVANLRLVLSVVQRFSSHSDKSDDMFQVGCVGLLKAIDNFDETLNVKFSTYAVPMIIGEIRRYLRDNNSVRVSRSIRDVAYKSLKVKEEIIKKFNREPTLDEIASVLEIPVSEVTFALDAISEPVSIYESVYNDSDDNLMLVDQISDKTSLDGYVESATLKEEISKLPERERNVLLLRYYGGRTQMEISDELDMSQAQVSRLEKSALKKLREAF